MGVYIKNGSGDIKKLAGYVTVRQNARWFLCTRTIEDNVEYYTVPKEAETYFKSINAYTIYSLGFNESNTTNTPKLRYGTTVLDIKDFSNQAGEVMVGQLNGVFQMFTQDLATDPKIYFVANTHKDEYDTEMSNTSTNAVQNKVIKAYADNIGTLAEAIRDNTTQIKPISGGLAIGGAIKPQNSDAIAIGGTSARAFGSGDVAIGDNAICYTSGNYKIAIGHNAKANKERSIAVGINAQTDAARAIQFGFGTNTKEDSLQIFGDNIYDAKNHVATFQNLQIGGVDEYPTLSGADAPTTTTVGKVKQFYVETTTPALYYCASITGTGTTEDPYVYNWTQAGGDETLAKQIQNNEVQIKTSNNGFRAGGAQIDDGYGVAIGNNSYAGSDSCVALGTGANAAFIDCYQIGSGWNTVSGTLQIKNDTIYDVNSHTAMFENIKQNGNNVYGVLQGETDPTEATVGAVGQFYISTATDPASLWLCTKVETVDSVTTYTWTKQGGKQLYQHNVVMTWNKLRIITFQLINDNSTAISNGSLVQEALFNAGFTNSNNILPCNCTSLDSNRQELDGLYYTGQGAPYIYYKTKRTELYKIIQIDNEDKQIIDNINLVSQDYFGAASMNSVKDTVVVL